MYRVLERIAHSEQALSEDIYTYIVSEHATLDDASIECSKFNSECKGWHDGWYHYYITSTCV